MEIYFNTATFDDIERDRKIKTEAQLSLIGGTMGLLTGFSIISGIEIVFFLIRLVEHLIALLIKFVTETTMSAIRSDKCSNIELNILFVQVDGLLQAC